MIAGTGSALYRRLYDGGLINDSFGTEVHSGRGYLSAIFDGESKDPKTVYQEILKEIETFRKNGIPAEDVNRVKKSVYGKAIRGLNDVDDVAGSLVNSYFAGVTVFDSIHVIADVTAKDINHRFSVSLHPERSAISIVEPNA